MTKLFYMVFWIYLFTNTSAMTMEDHSLEIDFPSKQQIKKAKRQYSDIQKSYKQADKDFNKIITSRQNYIQNYVDVYKASINEIGTESLKRLLQIYFPKNEGNKEESPEYFSPSYQSVIRDFLDQDIPLTEGVTDSLLRYLGHLGFYPKLNKVDGEFAKNHAAIPPILLQAHTRAHIRILHETLNLNGKNAAIITIESTAYFKSPYILWLEGVPEDHFHAHHQHGLQTLGVAVSKHQKFPGVARGAWGIPVKTKDSLDEISKNYDQDLKEIKERFEAKIKNILSEPDPDKRLTLNLEALRIKLDEDDEALKLFKMQFNLLKKEMQLHPFLNGDILSDLQFKYELAIEQGIYPYTANLSLSLNVIKNSKDTEGLIQFLETHDMLLVNSAGNDGYSLQEYEPFFMTYPKLLERIIIVGATDIYGSIAEFSNYPGCKLIAKHTIYTQGKNVNVLSGHQDNPTILAEGTSFAAPIVAGTLVLLKKYFPALNMLTLKKIILSETTPFPSYVDGYKRKEKAGCGQLNAFKAFLGAMKMNAKTQKSRNKKAYS